MLKYLLAQFSDPNFVFGCVGTFIALMCIGYWFDYKKCLKKYGAFGATHSFARKACSIVETIPHINRTAFVLSSSFQRVFCQHIEDLYFSLDRYEQKQLKVRCKSEFEVVKLLVSLSYDRALNMTFYQEFNVDFESCFFECCRYLSRFGLMQNSTLQRQIDCYLIAKNIFTSPDGKRLEFSLYGSKIPRYFEQFIK